MSRITAYATADGTTVATPRRIRHIDVFTVSAYFGMRVLDACTDTANLLYAMCLSHRDAVDESTAFLREGLQEIEALTSHKFLAQAAAEEADGEDDYEMIEDE